MIRGSQNPRLRVGERGSSGPPSQVIQQPGNRVVKHLGKLPDEWRDLAFIDRRSHGDGVGQEQPDGGAGDNRGKQGYEARNAGGAAQAGIVFTVVRDV